MKTYQTKYGELVRLPKKEILQMLKEGHTFTAPGQSLDTLQMLDDGNIQWMGRFDQGPTIFTQEEFLKKNILHNYKWAIDLIPKY